MKAIVSVCLGCTTSPLKLSLSSKIKKWNSDQLNEQTFRSYRFKIYRENSWFCIDKWAFHSVGHRKNSLKKKKTTTVVWWIFSSLIYISDGFWSYVIFFKEKKITKWLKVEETLPYGRILPQQVTTKTLQTQ